jgi:hypothetical protein
LSLELPAERRLSLGNDCEDNEPHEASLEEASEHGERPWKYKILALLCVLSLAGRYLIKKSCDLR